MTFDNNFGAEAPAPDKEPVDGNRSLFSLIADVPTLLSSLVRNEINLLKAELLNKAKNAGIGAVFFLIAIPVVVMAVIVLIISGVFALALVMPTWLAALIVSGALLVLAIILMALGVLSFKKLGGAIPDRTLSSTKEDIDVVTGRKS
ncbi:MAG: phage holin family protein [Microbacteriaceae bacterium]